MSTYVVIRKGFDHCKHFDAETAAKAIENIRYTDKAGTNHEGAHWTQKEVRDLTAAMKFAPCVTDEDKWVAFNATFADLCKVLTLEQIAAAAHAFWFADEDAPCDKIFRYIAAAKQRGKLPYFLKDNEKYTSAQKEPQSILERATARHAARTPEQIAKIRDAWTDAAPNKGILRTPR